MKIVQFIAQEIAKDKKIPPFDESAITASPLTFPIALPVPVNIL